MKLPELRIGHLVAKIPIMQGGMAVRISTARLAAAVADAGGIGLIAASGMSFDELRHEIRLARSLTKGIVGINIMVAARQFIGIVKTAIEEGIDLIVPGAGFSRDVFGLGRESGTPIVTMVSNIKGAKLAEKLGAAAVVVEGKEAGGHLGTNQSMRVVLPDIKKAINIPVLGAGGVINGRDIVDVMNLGADGVQMGTRFAASEESNAAPALKEFYLKAKPEDVVLIKSPVGLPGQAVKNPFAKKILEGTAPTPDSCDVCLKHCAKNFCIIKALIRAQQGDVESGLVFTGEYVHKIKEILPVKEIFSRLLKEIDEIN
ncbi:aldolase-type tim barrel [Lucifera butyrica]|uniref:Probable nitronate monooxygenase n=1 Tax=Lucifera butyrica TaxID=1351585 RepID=A0A498QZL8_9FIRM|nr:nitronate monooxygenase [Lucifera butyrica]VBB05656.1 aldolase-type tim barrel [Lucifera butyrica]